MMKKTEIVKIELNKLALLLQEKDELIDANSLLKRKLNSIVLDNEIGYSKELKSLTEENASLKQELKNEKEKLEKYYQKFLDMESIYLEALDKQKCKETLTKVDIPESTIDKHVLDDTIEFINKLDVKV
jgi:hypothetical protein